MLDGMGFFYITKLMTPEKSDIINLIFIAILIGLAGLWNWLDKQGDDD